MSESRYREARKKSGISAERASVELGISFTTLSSYEREATQPTAAVIKKMAEIYGVSADWLLKVK